MAVKRTPGTSCKRYPIYTTGVRLLSPSTMTVKAPRRSQRKGSKYPDQLRRFPACLSNGRIEAHIDAFLWRFQSIFRTILTGEGQSNQMWLASIRPPSKFVLVTASHELASVNLAMIKKAKTGHYYSGTLYLPWNHWNCFEDRVPVDFIYRHPISRWVAVIWTVW